MKSLFGGLLIVGATCIPSAAQENRRPDDVLQRRDQRGILVGRILKMTANEFEILVRGEREPRRILFADIEPRSIYRARLERIDKEDAGARMALGNWCMTHRLYSTAVREFEVVAKLDPSKKASIQKKKDEAHTQDARTRFEEAKGLLAKGRRHDAEKKLAIVMDRFADTPYGDQARALMGQIADEIKKDIQKKKAQLANEAQKAQDDKEKAVQREKEAVQNEIVRLIGEAAKLWTQGLDEEPRNLTRADRAWRSAETSLLKAKHLAGRMLKDNDIDTIKKGKELDARIDAWLVKSYFRLGRMWAVELSYPKALTWLNKAMRVPHDEQMDALINDILIQISKLKMRERGAARGF